MLEFLIDFTLGIANHSCCECMVATAMTYPGETVSQLSSTSCGSYTLSCLLFSEFLEPWAGGVDISVGLRLKTQGYILSTLSSDEPLHYMTYCNKKPLQVRLGTAEI